MLAAIMERSSWVSVATEKFPQSFTNVQGTSAKFKPHRLNFYCEWPLRHDQWVEISLGVEMSNAFWISDSVSKFLDPSLESNFRNFWTKVWNRSLVPYRLEISLTYIGPYIGNFEKTYIGPYTYRRTQLYTVGEGRFFEPASGGCFELAREVFYIIILW